MNPVAKSRVENTHRRGPKGLFLTPEPCGEPRFLAVGATRSVSHWRLPLFEAITI
jgi:hypothetical protein